LVYRLLFLLVAEERELLFDDTATPRQRHIYDEYYAVARLRPLADGRRASGDRHDDLWRRHGADCDRQGGDGAHPQAAKKKKN